MQKAIRILAIVLLLFNGIGALYGGLQLIIYPDGKSLGMQIEFLKYSVFPDYFIPGVILLTVNGLLSIATAAITLARVKQYYIAILLQGALLFGWIIVQILLLQFTFVLHFVMGAVGVILMAAGLYLMRQPNPTPNSVNS